MVSRETANLLCVGSIPAGTSKFCLLTFAFSSGYAGFVIIRDPRGGHNRHKINENFFKAWSPEMSYLLGYIFADGAVEDVRNSSRTCYLAITSADKEILVKIKGALNSSHPLYTRKPRYMLSPRTGKQYLTRATYVLRIGNIPIYNDLLSLGLKPRKSLDIYFPKIPTLYFAHFLRGYFDGDGCLTKTYKGISQVVFTSGSRHFLEGLSESLAEKIGIKQKNLNSSDRAYQIRYKKHETLKILNYMYSEIKNGLYLERKYQKYLSLLRFQPQTKSDEIGGK